MSGLTTTVAASKPLRGSDRKEAEMGHDRLRGSSPRQSLAILDVVHRGAETMQADVCENQQVREVYAELPCAVQGDRSRRL